MQPEEVTRPLRSQLALADERSSGEPSQATREFEELYLRVFRDRKLCRAAVEALDLEHAGRSAVRRSCPAGSTWAEHLWGAVTAVLEKRAIHEAPDRDPVANYALGAATRLTDCDPELCYAFRNGLRRLLRDPAELSAPELYERTFEPRASDLPPTALEALKLFLGTRSGGVVSLYLTLCRECAEQWGMVFTLQQFRDAQSSVWYRVLYSLL